MSAVKPRNLLPHDGAVPGLLLFRRRRVVRGLVRGCHGVDWHYVDEAVDFVNDTLVVRFLRPVEATHCLLVCAALDEDCVCGREAKLDFLARLGVLVNVLVFLVVLVKERHVGERGGLDVARELVNVVDRVPEPPAFVVVVASVDGVRRLVDAAVTHFSTESELVALVGRGGRRLRVLPRRQWCRTTL